MPDNEIELTDDGHVRVSGAQTPDTDHPTLRKVARAVISIAERQLAEETKAAAQQESDND